MEIKGKQFGVRVVRRAENDPHVCLQLLGEDDDNWFDIGNTFSAYWLEDLISVLKSTRDQLCTDTTFLEDTWGYRFNDKSK